MIALAHAFVLTALAMVSVSPESEPPVFLPLDLTAVLNADPWDPAAMAVPDIPYLDPNFVFIEGEAVFRAEGATVREMPEASGGAALHGLGEADEWAEWAFDVPFDSDEALLYVRVSRAVGEAEAAAGIENPFTILAASLNNRPGGIFYAVSSEHPDAFDGGIVNTNLGLIRMGRHVLRLSVRMAGEPVTIDCLWIAPRAMDLRDERGDEGRMRPPFPISVLAYAPGRIELEAGMPFDLVDPRENEGRGVLLPDAEGVTIPMNGETGDTLLLLGAGGTTGASAVVTVQYADGTEETTAMRWPGLYARGPAPAGEVTVPMGQFRRATVRRVPIAGKPLAAITVQPENGDRLVLLAATLAAGSARE